MLEISVNPYKSIVIVDNNSEFLTVCEGDAIEFAIESTGEVVKGVVTKFASKDEKLKIQIFNPDKNCEEIWSVVLIKEGSLKLVEVTNKVNDED